jgi:hypothetical protein
MGGRNFQTLLGKLFTGAEGTVEGYQRSYLVSTTKIREPAQGIAPGSDGLTPGKFAKPDKVRPSTLMDGKGVYQELPRIFSVLRVDSAPSRSTISRAAIKL